MASKNLSTPVSPVSDSSTRTQGKKEMSERRLLKIKTQAAQVVQMPSQRAPVVTSVRVDENPVASVRPGNLRSVRTSRKERIKDLEQGCCNALEDLIAENITTQEEMKCGSDFLGQRVKELQTLYNRPCKTSSKMPLR